MNTTTTEADALDVTSKMRLLDNNSDAPMRPPLAFCPTSLQVMIPAHPIHLHQRTLQALDLIGLVVVEIFRAVEHLEAGINLNQRSSHEKDDKEKDREENQDCESEDQVMTSREFCYWLQGYFEIEGNQPRPPEWQPSLNGSQISMIQKHLALVFKHEIDPSYGDQKHQDDLNKIHYGPYEPGIPVPTSNVLMRC